MGKESADYNGGVVHGIVAENIGMQFVNACVGLEISDDSYIIEREMEGGTEKVKIKSPVIIAGQKGLVEEKDLKIPNMRGIMSARTKPLQVVESTGDGATTNVLKSLYSTIPKFGFNVVNG